MMSDGDGILINVGMIFFGWLLGLLAPSIVDYNRKLRNGYELKIAIKSELKELQYRLLMSSYLMKEQYDAVDRAYLEKANRIISEYDGVHSSKNISDLICKLLELTDDDLQGYLASRKAENDSGMLLKKISVPYLDSKMDTLAWVNDTVRGRLLELKNQVAILNEVVDDSRYYYNLTFQNLSDDNHANATASTRDCYKHYARRAEVIVDMISVVMTALSKDLKNA